MIHDIYTVDIRDNAYAPFDRFLAVYEDKNPKATDFPRKDRKAKLMMSFKLIEELAA